MKLKRGRKIMAVVMSLLMVVGIMPTDWSLESVFADSETQTYTFDAADLSVADLGVTADKQLVTAGTTFASGFLKVIGDSNTYRTTSSTDASKIKAIELAKAATGSLQFTVSGTADVTVKASSTGTSNYSDIQIVNATTGTAVVEKNGVITVYGTTDTQLTYTGLEAGTYLIQSSGGSNTGRGVRVLAVSAVVASGTSQPSRADWSGVAAPVLGDITVADGKITVPYTMLIGYDGADKVTVTMKNSSGTVVDTKSSASDSTAGSLVFTPSASGDYTFSITASRDSETDKTGTDKTVSGFVLPLSTPVFSSATSTGSGSVELVWSEVAEADSYQVSYSTDGTNYSTPVSVSVTDYTVTGLTVGQNYTFKLKAVRNNPTTTSSETTITASVTQDAQTVWSFASFGSGVSSDTTYNGYSGNANDGSVKVWSLGGKGKIVPASTDGLSFYYTTVPQSMNFTLSATVTVDSWTLSNGQEGFGLMAADRVGTSGDSSVFWNNSYMASVTKVEYYADSEGNVTNDTTANKISMKLGIGSQEKIGVTTSNLSKLEANDTQTVNNDFSSTMTTLETSTAAQGAGTYNVIGNSTNTAVSDGSSALTSFKLTIQKNNTGYFISYTDEDGNTTTNKYYDTEALSNLDDNIYVGFFASRYASITVSDISLTTIDPALDEDKEETVITQVVPNYTVESASTSNSSDYDLTYVSNADGHVVIYDQNNNVVGESDVLAGTKNIFPVTLDGGNNVFTISMTPNADYKPGENQILSSYDTVTFTKTVTYNKFSGDIIYVSPDGTSSGTGSKENPLDIYTAVKYASPGQKILLMEGTYSLTSTVTIARGIDGTADQMIYLMADPEATQRPVLNANQVGMGMEVAGDYWYLQGFDVTNSADGKNGIHLSGSYCTMDNLQTYHNGNTGLQVSRYLTSDTSEYWPSNDLIINCTSYGNADKGYEDADGFAAKLTVGEGIVFDGCIAYNNADDGWDLFAKVETGGIGSVTIQNCVAYGNGYLEDGTNAGNGNGFKLGGSSISGYHKLINCVSFDNKAKGIDSNSCPDIQVTNCTTYNNGGSNIALYTNDTANTDFSASGVISYRTQYTDVAETIKPKGTQDTSKIYQSNDYYWNVTGTTANNSVGTITNDWFVSTDTLMNYTTHVYSATPVTRNSDNTINMNGLLVLSQKAVGIVGANSGAELNTYDGKVAGVASPVISIDGTISSGLVYTTSKTSSSSTSSNATVQTSDESRGMAYLMSTIMAAICAGYAVSKRKKKHQM